MTNENPNQFGIKLSQGNVTIEVFGPDNSWVEGQFNKIKEDCSSPLAHHVKSESKNPHEATKQDQKNIVNGWGKLANVIGVTIDQLDDIYDTKDSEKILVHKTINVGRDVDKQKALVRLMLIAGEHVTGQNEFSGRAMIPIMKELGVSSLGNLAMNLKNDKNINLVQGKYRLNIPGKQEAKELITQLLQE